MITAWIEEETLGVGCMRDKKWNNHGSVTREFVCLCEVKRIPTICCLSYITLDDLDIITQWDTSIICQSDDIQEFYTSSACSYISCLIYIFMQYDN